MSNVTRAIVAWICGLTLATGLVACGGDGATEPNGSSAAASVQINGTEPLSVGVERRLTAVVRDQQGRAVTGAVITWTSATPEVLSVSSDGVVRGLGAGPGSVRASVGSVSGNATITVQAPVANLKVTAPSLDVAVGGQAYLLAAAYDAEGGLLADRRVTFESDDPGVLSVDATGLVTGLAAGSSGVRLRSEGVTRVVPVTVGTLAAGSFSIEQRVVGDMAAETRAALEAALADAAARWERVIVAGFNDTTLATSASACGGLVPVPQVTVGDLLVYLRLAEIDGPGVIAAQGPVCLFRRVDGRVMPAAGVITVDIADVVGLLANPSGLRSVLTHELGHVLGFGTLWNVQTTPDLLNGTGTTRPLFVGAEARRQHQALGFGAEAGVWMQPGVGSVPGHGNHWDVRYAGEVMTPTGGASLSRITVAALADVGFTVDLRAADPFVARTPAAGGASFDRAPWVAPSSWHCGTGRAH